MQRLALLIFLFPLQVLALAPECPGHSSRQQCLNSVEDIYKDTLDLIDFLEDQKEKKDKLILAAQDVKFYESQACTKTCVN